MPKDLTEFLAPDRTGIKYPALQIGKLQEGLGLVLQSWEDGNLQILAKDPESGEMKEIAMKAKHDFGSLDLILKRFKCKIILSQTEQVQINSLSELVELKKFNWEGDSAWMES